MTDRIHHLNKYRPPQADGRIGTGQGRDVKEPAASGEPRPVEASRPSVNDTARDVSLQHALDGVQIDVPAGDSDRIMLLMSLVAEIVDAYRFGHKNITDEYLRLAAATKRILADDLRGDAA